LKAAKLYLKDGETGKAEEVLASARSSYPDDIQTLQELLKLKAAPGGDLREADSLAEHLRRLTKEEDWTLETCLFVSMRQASVPQAAVDEEVQKFRLSPKLCPSAKKAYENGCRNRLRADANQSASESDLCTSALYFVKAVECQMREKVFAPFRIQVLDSAQRDTLLNQRGDPDEYLSRYVDGDERITLGQMMNSIRYVRTLNIYVQKHFPRLLSPEILGKLKHLVSLRNAETHETSDPQLAAQARALAESVIEAMS
jgi:hypothetical protein